MSNEQDAILFLTSWYPVETNPTHGIFIRNHAIALSQFRKVIVVYAYSSNQKSSLQIEEAIVNQNLTEYRLCYSKSFFSVKPLSSFLQFIKYKKAHQQLIAHLQQKKIKVKAIQVNVIFPVAMVLDLYRKAFKADYTIVEHWSGYLKQDGNYKGGILNRTTQAAIASTKKIWHVSEPQKQAMLEHGLNGQYELIYNVVDTTLFKPGKKSNSRIQLLHVSSLVEREKNISRTFKAIKKLQNKGLDFDFVVIGGDVEELNNAKNLAKELQLANVKFTGVLKPEHVAEYMQQSDALILFSHFEGMPVVVLEAMSCGLPVFVSKVGQLPYIINKDYGVLVNTGNESQLVSGLENLIKGQLKFDSVAMREFVLMHASLEAVGKQICDFYSRQ
ncbi:MAG: glycosyltransferase family 4 protein [Bacteroidia bacterium]|nr:glycosyltransferase family 4 protein [Bacteroidia bacterium]